jgi:hypothetical protein
MVELLIDTIDVEDMEAELVEEEVKVVIQNRID